MPGINVHLTFTCKIFQGLCFPCHASRDQSAPAGPCAVCGIQSPLSVSPAHAGASCGWLRVVSTGDPGMRQGCGAWRPVRLPQSV